MYTFIPYVFNFHFHFQESNTDVFWYLDHSVKAAFLFPAFIYVYKLCYSYVTMSSLYITNFLIAESDAMPL